MGVPPTRWIYHGLPEVFCGSGSSPSPRSPSCNLIGVVRRHDRSMEASDPAADRLGDFPCRCTADRGPREPFSSAPSRASGSLTSAGGIAARIVNHLRPSSAARSRAASPVAADLRAVPPSSAGVGSSDASLRPLQQGRCRAADAPARAPPRLNGLRCRDGPRASLLHSRFRRRAGQGLGRDYTSALVDTEAARARRTADLVGRSVELLLDHRREPRPSPPPMTTALPAWSQPGCWFASASPKHTAWNSPPCCPSRIAGHGDRLRHMSSPSGIAADRSHRDGPDHRSAGTCLSACAGMAAMS